MPEGKIKIKAKDLTYESTLPPFLQRLHAQNAGRGDQDRHERPIARPTRAKAHDEDDEPTVVDEAGETVSKGELENMSSAQDGDARGEDENVNTVGEKYAKPKASGATQDEVQRSDQKITDGTATKKRKVAKVVGEDDEAETSINANGKDEAVTKQVIKKAKKKAKPIKLAFDEDDET